ncbi:hypothetical protein PAPYR_7659 [Paratrimastix pyriformis]|uniref:Uncharacterized protein n=1 Tax=Paratrimastix pyriformis TaxID=342808 RepID=A0ABQ8UCK4_9EUKA|nr:hypothetical protein PAPYR_7659 [Paratrimastix pyriformis]
MSRHLPHPSPGRLPLLLPTPSPHRQSLLCTSHSIISIATTQFRANPNLAAATLNNRAIHCLCFLKYSARPLLFRCFLPDENAAAGWTRIHWPSGPPLRPVVHRYVPGALDPLHPWQGAGGVIVLQRITDSYGQYYGQFPASFPASFVPP